MNRIKIEFETEIKTGFETEIKMTIRTEIKTEIGIENGAESGMIAVGVIGMIVFGFAMVRAADRGDKLPGPKPPVKAPEEWKIFVERRFERVD